MLDSYEKEHCILWFELFGAVPHDEVFELKTGVLGRFLRGFEAKLTSFTSNLLQITFE